MAKGKLLMTLDETIMHALSRAGDDTPKGKEYGQLAEWLTELRKYRAAATEDHLAGVAAAQEVLDTELDRIDAEVNGRGHFRITPDDAILVLNEAVRADPEAVLALVEYRVPCNDALADHPSIQVRNINPPPDTSKMDATNPALLAQVKTCEVGLLGILNGLFGSYPLGHSKFGWGPIRAEYASAAGPITGFSWTVSPEDEPIKPPSTTT